MIRTDRDWRSEWFKSLVPKMFWDARLSDFKDSYHPEVVPGVVIVGPVGTGKTHLAAALVFDLIEKFNLTPGTFAWTTAIALLRAIRESFDSGDTTALERRYRTVDLLVIDDLGAEKPTEWASAILLDVVNTRLEDLLPTIVTTNSPSLKDVNPRLHDRLREFTAVSLLGPSRRGRG